MFTSAMYEQVDTVKRLCISRLPKVLVIQLKRFDYDWERLITYLFINDDVIIEIGRLQ